MSSHSLALRLLPLFAALALASTRTEPEPETATTPTTNPDLCGGLQLELATANDPGLLGVRLGLHVASESQSVVLGVGLLGAELHEDLLMEVYASYRKHLVPMHQQALVPFVGLGGMVAFSSESYPAEDDDVDNDNNGAVDEDGEEATRVTDLFAGLTPELGLLIYPRQGVSFCPVLRYYVKSTGLDDSQWVFALGVQLNF
jgi:hypothetical protein